MGFVGNEKKRNNDSLSSRHEKDLKRERFKSKFMKPADALIKSTSVGGRLKEHPI